MLVGVVLSVREELVGPVHTTSTITPSTTMSSSKVMKQVRVKLEPIKAGEDDTSTIIEEVLTMDKKIIVSQT